MFPRNLAYPGSKQKGQDGRFSVRKSKEYFWEWEPEREYKRGVRERPHKKAGSGPSKRTVNRKETRNATFLYLLIR